MRVAILNNLIETRVKEVPNIGAVRGLERKRIRSFAWAELLPHGPERGQKSGVEEIQLLAIGNDAGEVMIFWLLSPFQGFPEWDFRLLLITDLKNAPGQHFPGREKWSLLAEKLQCRSAATSLSWGGRWEVDDEHGQKSFSTTLSVACGVQMTLLSLQGRFTRDSNDDHGSPVLTLSGSTHGSAYPKFELDPLEPCHIRRLQDYDQMSENMKKLVALHVSRHGLGHEFHPKVWAMVQHPADDERVLACVSSHPSHMLVYPTSHSETYFLVSSDDEKCYRELTSLQRLDFNQKRGDVLASVQESIIEFGKVHINRVGATESANGEDRDERILSAVSAAASLSKDIQCNKDSLLLETCTICLDQNIPFRYLETAQCLKGHEFGKILPRCTL